MSPSPERGIPCGRPDRGVRTGRRRRAPLAAALLLVGGCSAWTGAGPGCRTVSEPAALPGALQESSGVAIVSARPGVFWTHNDGGGGVLYAVDAGGALVDSVVLAVDAVDLEDLARAPCPAGTCLWLADTGDNYAERDDVAVYRLEEPVPGRGQAGDGAVSAERFPFRYPDGPVDVEAIFVRPDGALHLISKGSDAAPVVFRYPPPLRADSTVTLEAVQTLGDGPRALPRQVTGAAASSDGRLVAIRTYETLTFMAFRDGRLHTVEDGEVSLRTLREGQGEAVALGEDGEVVLTSEAGPLGGRGSIVVMRCEAPEDGGGEG